MLSIVGGAGVVGEGDAGLAIGTAAGDAVALNINDGTVLYIDPSSRQAAVLLQQAGFMLGEDGTVQTIGGTDLDTNAAATGGIPQELLLPSAGVGKITSSANPAVQSDISKQDMVDLPSAPDATVKPKDIIEESLVSKFDSRL